MSEWNPDFNSPLLNLAKEIYQELSDDAVLITAAHASLETGIFKSKFPELDMIVIGPTLDFIHSPDERLDIQSVEKFWDILIILLEKISKK